MTDNSIINPILTVRPSFSRVMPLGHFSRDWNLTQDELSYTFSVLTLDGFLGPCQRTIWRWKTGEGPTPPYALLVTAFIDLEWQHNCVALSNAKNPETVRERIANRGHKHPFKALFWEKVAKDYLDGRLPEVSARVREINAKTETGREMA